MITFKYHNRLLVLAIGLILTVCACQDETSAPQANVSVTTTSLGTVLTGDGGRTLYFFAPDVNGNVNCTGGCAGVWPAFYQANLVVGAGLTANDFTTVTRPDGTKQTAFQGWPLYYYKNDAKAGDVNGENVGNNWSVAKTNYTVIRSMIQLVGNDGKNYTSDYKEGTGTSTYFADQLGRTLYAFNNDKANTNTFTKADFSNNAIWPIAEVTSIKEIPTAYNKADFRIINVFGHSQLTYKGWPLYYFGADAGVRGSTKGVSIGRPGLWMVLNANTPTAPQ